VSEIAGSTRWADAYRIDRELGDGGMSRVFLATEVGLKRQVEVNVLPLELTGGVMTAPRMRSR
jgi:hypothetical protein